MSLTIHFVGGPNDGKVKEIEDKRRLRILYRSARTRLPERYDEYPTTRLPEWYEYRLLNFHLNNTHTLYAVPKNAIERINRGSMRPYSIQATYNKIEENKEFEYLEAQIKFETVHPEVILKLIRYTELRVEGKYLCVLAIVIPQKEPDFSRRPERRESTDEDIYGFDTTDFTKLDLERELYG